MSWLDGVRQGVMQYTPDFLQRRMLSGMHAAEQSQQRLEDKSFAPGPFSAIAEPFRYFGDYRDAMGQLTGEEQEQGIGAPPSGPPMLPQPGAGGTGGGGQVDDVIGSLLEAEANRMQQAQQMQMEQFAQGGPVDQVFADTHGLMRDISEYGQESIGNIYAAAGQDPALAEDAMAEALGALTEVAAETEGAVGRVPDQQVATAQAGAGGGVGQPVQAAAEGAVAPEMQRAAREGRAAGRRAGQEGEGAVRYMQDVGDSLSTEQAQAQSGLAIAEATARQQLAMQQANMQLAQQQQMVEMGADLGGQTMDSVLGALEAQKRMLELEHMEQEMQPSADPQMIFDTALTQMGPEQAQIAEQLRRMIEIQGAAGDPGMGYSQAMQALMSGIVPADDAPSEALMLGEDPITQWTGEQPLAVPGWTDEHLRYYEGLLRSMMQGA